jgi:hypothetical protein
LTWAKILHQRYQYKCLLNRQCQQLQTTSLSGHPENRAQKGSLKSHTIGREMQSQRDPTSLDYRVEPPVKHDNKSHPLLVDIHQSDNQ